MSKNVKKMSNEKMKKVAKPFTITYIRYIYPKNLARYGAKSRKMSKNVKK
tara:strand:+ start:274 stop:423 length:150 start_codon:yes stop_codon:yes gene_type:complete